MWSIVWLHLRSMYFTSIEQLLILFESTIDWRDGDNSFSHSFHLILDVSSSGQQQRIEKQPNGKEMILHQKKTYKKQSTWTCLSWTRLNYSTQSFSVTNIFSVANTSTAATAAATAAVIIVY